MKTIVSNPYHLWANEIQSFAKNSSGNRSFQDSKAFSYAAIIAVRVKNSKGVRAFLVSPRNWTVTTSKHQSEVWQAVRGQLAFRVPSLGTNPGDHSANVRYLWESIADSQGKAKRARVNKEWHLNDAIRLLEVIREYVSFFGLKGKEFRIPDDTLEGMDTRIEEYRKADAIAAKKREKANAIAEQRRKEAEIVARQKYREDVAQWLAGENVQLSYRFGDGFAFLRVKDGIVQTSQGAEVPIGQVKESLPKVLPFVRDCREIRLTGIQFGGYTLHGVDAQGTVIVGCHRFQRAEVLRFAELLENSA